MPAKRCYETCVKIALATAAIQSIGLLVEWRAPNLLAVSTNRLPLLLLSGECSPLGRLSSNPRRAAEAGDPSSVSH